MKKSIIILSTSALFLGVSVLVFLVFAREKDPASNNINLLDQPQLHYTPGGGITIPFDLKRLFDYSEVIFLGTVESLETSDPTKPRTYVTFSVEYYIKGNENSEIIISRETGVWAKAPNGEFFFSGFGASYSPGEQVVVFLDTYQNGDFGTTGLSYGKFLISADASNGQAFVTNPLIFGSSKLVTLKDFLQQIESLAN